MPTGAGLRPTVGTGEFRDDVNDDGGCVPRTTGGSCHRPSVHRCLVLGGTAVRAGRGCDRNVKQKQCGRTKTVDTVFVRGLQGLCETLFLI